MRLNWKISSLYSIAGHELETGNKEMVRESKGVACLEEFTTKKNPETYRIIGNIRLISKKPFPSVVLPCSANKLDCPWSNQI
ncbi:MAG: hypothetical protein IPN15_16415 [Saprospiraceae bacterium]|nr:hypothetical protein [Candidatus Vicinibacter affinis]